MENKIPLSKNELSSIRCGEATITLSAVMAVMAIAVVAVAIYKLFYTEDGLIQLPGGYKFQWK